jgi:hypothetical protein
VRFPAPESLKLDWKPSALESWISLVNEVRQLGENVGKGDLFQQVTARLQQMSRTMDFSSLPKLLDQRVTARALTQLWLEDENFRRRLMNKKLLQSLIAMQKPVLGIMPLHNLITLYFREYDRLDQLGEGFRSLLQGVIEDQLELRLGGLDKNTSRDSLTILHSEANWLLFSDGPKKLVDYVHRKNIALAEAFVHFELRGLDIGRYGDICRAHYYLEKLKQIQVGQYDEVFAELLKPTVGKAPYEGEKRIGHAALEILIDRTDGDPGDSWQNFIMDMAGDPRIASSAPNYREWWKPLGEERIEKVRGWLAKEDLKLFLRALEQYGKESGKDDLQRMFPARKYFLEGLERLKLVRRTRLMLGKTAEYAVKKILGSELKTSYVKLTDMTDKAVIYIDCGDFCIIEGSHSFKLWVYLATPSEQVLHSYDVKTLSHYDLTNKVPASYKQLYGNDAAHKAITHHPNTWQKMVFDFLADQGIALDIEKLLSPQDYDRYLGRFGMPVVANTVKNDALKKVNLPSSMSHAVTDGNNKVVLEENQNSSKISKLAINILKYLYPNEISDVKTMAYVLKTANSKIIDTIYHELSEYCVQDRDKKWKISTVGFIKISKEGLLNDHK